MKKLINSCYVLLLAVTLFSCNDEREDIAANLNKRLNKYTVLKTNLEKYTTIEESENQFKDYLIDVFTNNECFRFKYPIKLKVDYSYVIKQTAIVNETIINKEELNSLFLFGGIPSIIYPISIINKENKENVITDSTAFDTFYNNCNGIANCNDCKNCFEFSFPITFIKENGNIIETYNDQDLKKFIKNLAINELFKLSYPIEIRTKDNIIEKK